MNEDSPSAPNHEPAPRWRRTVKGFLRSEAGNPDAFGSEASFSPALGAHWAPGGAGPGYYIDFGFKAEAPDWPPWWFPALTDQLHIAVIQWALGALERHLDGQGEQWLAAARAAGEHLVSIQHRSGPQAGGWRHLFPMPHTYRLDPPWLSGIAQGEGASLLVRLHAQTGDERFAEAARAALRPMRVPAAQGGVLGEVDGAPLAEEYPSDPPSHVLNGAIFAAWGAYDVAHGLGDAEAGEQFRALAAALAARVGRWDTGAWSRYDLYPHPLPNLSSPAYHLLHIRQLEALERLVADPAPLRAARERFESYRASAAARRAAVVRKVGFRLLVPRNPALAQRLPWNELRRRRHSAAAGGDVLVLCYHAVSPDWDAALSVTPAAFEEQMAYLHEQGYRGVTFAEAATKRHAGRVVAVTFDDAYRSVLGHARPVLDRFDLPATVFVASSHMDGGKPLSWPGIEHWLATAHARELAPMSWADAREVAQHGWEIGSHSATHRSLPRLRDEELRVELERSRAACEDNVGEPCETIAYPFGDVDRRVIEATARAGYAAAAGLEGRRAEPRLFNVPRVGIYHVDGMRSFRLKVSPAARRLRAARPLRPAVGAVRVLRPRERSGS